MRKKNIFKLSGIGLFLLSGVLMIAQNVIENKQMEAAVEDEVSRQLAEREEEES